MQQFQTHGPNTGHGGCMPRPLHLRNAHTRTPGEGECDTATTDAPDAVSDLEGISELVGQLSADARHMLALKIGIEMLHEAAGAQAATIA